MTFATSLFRNHPKRNLLTKVVNVMVDAEGPLTYGEILSRIPELSPNPCDIDVLLVTDVLSIMRSLGYIVCTNVGVEVEQERFSICPLLWMAHL